MKYNLEKANKLLDFIKSLGVRCELIGSLKSKGCSDHGIDILLLDGDLHIQRIIESLSAKSIVRTDWDGYYFKETLFGDIDFFIERPPKKWIY